MTNIQPLKTIKFRTITDTNSERDLVSDLNNIDNIQIDPCRNQFIVYRKDGIVTYVPLKTTWMISFK